MSKLLGECDVWEWPMNRHVASQVVRVRIVKGQERILDKFKELRVRAEIVRNVAYLFIEHHMEGLMHLEGARQIHAKMQQGSVKESLKKHVDVRVREQFSPDRYPMPDGVVLCEFKEMVSDTGSVASSKQTFDSVRSHFGSSS